MQPRNDDTGSGTEEQAFTPSKALLFKTLSGLWVFPSITSLFIIASAIPKSGDFVTFMRGVRLEQWVSLGLLLVHPVLIALAIRYRRLEQLQASEPDRKPGCTSKNVY